MENVKKISDCTNHAKHVFLEKIMDQFNEFASHQELSIVEVIGMLEWMKLCIFKQATPK